MADNTALLGRKLSERQRADRTATAIESRLAAMFATPAGTITQSSSDPHDAALSVDAGTPTALLDAGTLVVTGNDVHRNGTMIQGWSQRDNDVASYVLHFDYDGSAFELDLAASQQWITEVTVYADNQFVGHFGGNTGTTDAHEMFVKVTMPDARPRTYRVHIAGCLMYGMYLQPDRTLHAPTLPRAPRVVVASDSYGEGVHADFGRGFVDLLGVLSGYPDVRAGAAGGSGYLQDGPNTHVHLAGRMATDVTYCNPDMVIVALGFNDAGYGQTPSAVAAEAKVQWKALTDAGKRLVVVGPWDGKVGQEFKDMDDALVAAAFDAGVTYISPQREGWLKANPALMYSDAAHPVNEGHMRIAAYLAAHLGWLTQAPAPARTITATTTTTTGGGSGPTRVTYDSTTGWPARPSTTDPVEWYDPTGTAPNPTGAQAGDTLVVATPAGLPKQILTVTEQTLTSGEWYVGAGAAIVDTAAGTITLPTTGDKAVLAQRVITGGGTATISATKHSSSNGAWAYWLDFMGGGSYISGAGSSGPVTDGTGLTIPIPNNADHVSITIEGQAGDAGSAVLDTVSLTRTAP